MLFQAGPDSDASNADASRYWNRQDAKNAKSIAETTKARRKHKNIMMRIG